MLIKKPEDFAMGDDSKDYCVHCTRPGGTMQSYQEKLDSMSQFIVKTQGLDETAVRNAANSMMAKLPAWQDSSVN